VILQRKDGEKVSRVKRRMDLAVHCRTARFHIGDVKKMVVGTAWEADPQALPDRRMGAVAARNVGSVARLDAFVGPPESDAQPTARFLERDKLRLALDVHTDLGKTIDQ